MSAEARRRLAPPVYTVAKPGPFGLFIDLWGRGGSFRNYFEFALIGAIVLAFVQPLTIAFPQVDRVLSSVFGGAQTVPPPALGPGHSVDTAAAPTPPIAPAPAPVPSGGQPAIAQARLPTLRDLRFDISMHDRAPESMRPILQNAHRLIFEQNAMNHALVTLRGLANQLHQAGQNPLHPHIEFLNGMALLGVGSAQASANGANEVIHAAENGLREAMTAAGVLRITGSFGIPTDRDAGVMWLLRAIDAGEPQAGRILGHVMLTGGAGTVDPPSATTALERAVSLGDTQAMIMLGTMYMGGRFVARDDVRAEQLFARAAQSGDVEGLATFAMTRLMPFINGQTRDPSEALRLLTAAAERNHPQAMWHLGMFYVQYGRATGHADEPRAVALFRDCALRTNHGPCWYSYGYGLQTGRGIAVDPVMAYSAYLRARARGHAQATHRVRELEQQLSVPDRMRGFAAARNAERAKPGSTGGAAPGQAN